jgi:hypothetical protein
MSRYFITIALETAIKKVQENQERIEWNRMEWNGIYQLLIFGANDDILDENNISKNREVLLQTNKKAGLHINKDKTKHMFMSHHQNSGHNHNLITANKCLKNVTNFKYLETRVIS